MLKVGDIAPDFECQTTDGRALRLSDLRGRRVVLYFFPKAFTPGCTFETRRFRDNYPDVAALGAEVIGISVDEHSTQCDFAKAEELSFPLVADAERDISRAYDALWPVIAIDKRVTYVIDPEGRIEAVFRHEFQVSRHLDDVVQHLKRVRGAEPAAAH